LKTNAQILKSAGKKLAVLVLLGAITIGAFATLGDGKAGKSKPKKLLSTKTPAKPGIFSLQSGYQFRGNQVISFQGQRYLNMNTTVTYQQGSTTYMLPLKKKVILNNKVVFNPNAATR
jgi:hypothetical protein